MSKIVKVNSPTNKALKILLITNSLVLLAGAMLGPIYAIFVEEVGGDLLDASYAFAVFSIVAGTTAYITGKYSDKTKDEELIVAAGYLIMGIAFLSYTLVSTVAGLLVVSVLVGLGEAIYSPSFSSVYSKHLDPHKEATEWGAWEVMYYFSTALGAIVGGKIAITFGFEVLFVIMALLAFCSALYIYFLPRKAL